MQLAISFVRTPHWHPAQPETAAPTPPPLLFPSLALLGVQGAKPPVER